MNPLFRNIIERRKQARFVRDIILLRLLFVFAASGFSLSAQSQAYYFFVNEISVPGGEAYTYKTLLVLNTDGSAVARLQYNLPGSNELYLHELNLIDSSIDNISPNKYLMCRTAPALIAGAADPGFLVPRFVFQKKYDSSGYYYEPSAVEVKLADNNWHLMKMNTNEQKTLENLKENEPLVASFYFETDEFYRYVFEKKPRAIPEVRTEQLFLIIVANTNDETVGKGAKADLANISQLYTTMARDLGIKTVFTTYIFGDGYNKTAVEKALEKLKEQKPRPVDIVVFHYSGHGFRLPGDVSLYARMSFRTAVNRIKKEVGDNLGLEEVYNRIKALNPKVCIVSGDCCNANIYENPAFGSEMLKPKGGGILGEFNLANAKKLFLPPAPVSMIIGSVKKDHLAVVHPETGGYFTSYFTAELEKNLWGFFYRSVFLPNTQSNSSWLRIIVDASNNTYWKSIRKQCGKTENDRCIQRAEFELSPKQ
jgi:Caspase domain